MRLKSALENLFAAVEAVGLGIKAERSTTLNSLKDQQLHANFTSALLCVSSNQAVASDATLALISLAVLDVC